MRRFERDRRDNQLPAALSPGIAAAQPSVGIVLQRLAEAVEIRRRLGQRERAEIAARVAVEQITG